MIVTKKFLEEALDETIARYRQFYEIPSIKLKYIDKNTFLESAKENNLIKKLIQSGIYKNFESEYTNFLVVYHWDKNIFSLMLNGCYYITCCFEIVKDKLKPFKPSEVKNYLKYLFAHEITHIIEESVFKEKLDELTEMYGRELAGEILADEMACKIIPDKSDYKKIDAYLNKVIQNRINKLKQK